jgi:hypothetical protein
MMRIIAIGLALVVVLSCAAVLVSPDFGDDVDGALHHLVKKHKLISASLLRLRPIVRFGFSSLIPQISSIKSSPRNLLDLVCVRLCQIFTPTCKAFRVVHFGLAPQSAD